MIRWGRTMGKYHLPAVMFVMITTLRTASAEDCYKASTSQGLLTLSEGQFACAELKDGEVLEDLGKNYILCFRGKVFSSTCPADLRWDTAINTCYFPEKATCHLNDRNIVNNPVINAAATASATIKSTAITTRAEITPRKKKTTKHTSMRTTRATTRTTSTPAELPSVDHDIEYKMARGASDTSRPTRTTTTNNPNSDKFVDGLDCRDVMTSQGSRNLKHGQKSCAHVGTNDTESDLGRRFITCSFGQVYIQECQPGLRYDTSTGLCNWPEVSTCETMNDRPVLDDRSLTIVASAGPSWAASGSTPSQIHTPRPRPIGGCSSSDCKLPNCFCFGDTPSTIPVEDTPMFVMLTFDDAITASLYNSYFHALVVDNRYNLHNPNGCRIKSTFFVSHENTDYSKVKAVWNAGNEIGSHTIHHQLPQGDNDSDYPQMVAEIQGLKDEMLKATGNQILVNSIVGFRAPYLRVAGDVQYKALRDFHFLYDTSIININIRQGKKPHWPYTLDHLVLECINPPCPRKSHPGLWEVPLNGWVGDDKQGCSMVDACSVGNSSWTASEEEWHRFYARIFKDHFYPTKVPMPIFTHGSQFIKYPGSYPAMTKWFQDILRTHKDVWFVTPTQVINWMKTPLSNKDMIAKKWGC